jgi:hypothetical protein
LAIVTKYENEKKPYSFYIDGYLLELIIKIRNLSFFPPNLANLYHLFNENPLYSANIDETYARLFFFGAILPKKKSLVWHPTYFYSPIL